MEEELIRGDSAVVDFSLTDDDGQVIPMSMIDTLILTARTHPDYGVLFTKDKEDFTLENDIYSVEILPEDTQELNIKRFCFDVETTLIDGTRGTLLGKIKLIEDITTHRSGGADNED